MIAMLWGNPEFRRNVLCEFSASRLLVDPLLIGLTLAVMVSSESDVKGIVIGISQIGFIFLTVIWGARQAGKAFSREFAEGTWDGQRMSGLTPWQMTWGKLLGSTLNAWYDGAIMMALFLIAVSIKENLYIAVLGALGWIGFAVAIHVINMIQILFNRDRLVQQRRLSSLIVFAILLFGWGVGSFAYDTDVFTLVQKIHWWGIEFSGAFFAVASVLAMSAWAVTALWQAMRRELLERNHPGWWLAFLLFWLFWAMGLLVRPDASSKSWPLFFLACALVAWGSVYPPLLISRKDPGYWLHLFTAWQRRDRALLLHLFPNWITSIALGLILSLVAELSATVLQSDRSSLSFPAMLLSSPLVLIPFVIRDVAIVLWFNLAPRAKAPDGAALVVLAVLYLLIPLLLDIGKGNPSILYYAFIPGIFHEHSSSGALICGTFFPLLQAAGALFLLRLRWQTHWAAAARS
ncbi:MAG: hypothetical protein LBB76_02395 [Azoarcus sp.]|jgi:hypothetical protein|nr:hypothetical protein [Azoarcus sp.]